MSECSQLAQDPFLVSGEKWVDNMVIKSALLGARREFGMEPLDLESKDAFGPWEWTNEAVAGVRHVNAKKARSKSLRGRVGIAALGGILLVGPMWLMTLHNTPYTALISTTVLVAGFGLSMAYFLDGNLDVLSSTAAYAAVLVVFVGLNPTSG